MEHEYSGIQTMLADALRRCDSRAIEDVLKDLNLALIGEKEFPESLFDTMLDLLENSAVANLENSHVVLYFFRWNWDLLSEKQRRILLPPVEQLYPQAKDWMFCFMMTELFGERLASEDVLRSFLRLKELPSAIHRKFVPHGLEHIVADSGDPGLAKRAMGELLRMKTDPAASVREEVEVSLGRLRAQGLC